MKGEESTPPPAEDPEFKARLDKARAELVKREAAAAAAHEEFAEIEARLAGTSAAAPLRSGDSFKVAAAEAYRTSLRERRRRTAERCSDLDEEVVRARRRVRSAEEDLGPAADAAPRRAPPGAGE